MIRFVVKRSARFWLLAVTSFAQAGPLPVAAVRNEHEPAASRRYEVREDSRTGRLVRVAVYARLSGKRKAAPGSVKTGDAAPGNRVVQGSSARGSQSGSGARVDIDALVRAAAGRHSVDARFVHEVIRQESNYDLFAVSSKGACGLMQLMPGTARDQARRLSIPYQVNRLVEDPAYNIRIGSAFLHGRIDHYGGSIPLALAAYNAGSGNVGKWLRAHGDPRGNEANLVNWILLIPLTETRNYVQRVMERISAYEILLSPGASPSIPLRHLAS